MRYLKNRSTDPYYNIAFDAYCLERLDVTEPVFYVWQNRPAVIVGVNQQVLTEVNVEYLKEHHIALVRRVTGGGAVYHDLGNVNYTIIGRSSDLEHDYPGYMHYVLDALRSLGVQAELSGRNDIMVEGRKVSGYAKRVYKDRLMVHGTLMYDVNVDELAHALSPSAEKLQAKGIQSVRSRVGNLRSCLPQIKDVDAFRDEMERILSNDYADAEYLLSEKHRSEIQQLADNKFTSWEWTFGRAPRATLERSAHLACGTVEVHIALMDGRIITCTFGGDFIGNLPCTALEEALVGVPYDIDAVAAVLGTFDLALYFDNVTLDSLMSVIFE